MRLEFKTRKEAQDVIDKINSRRWIPSHVEYARPRLKARKVKNENVHYIHVDYHYYDGTLHAKENGAMTQQQYDEVFYYDNSFLKRI